MRTLYIDCAMGAAGDMLTAALLVIGIAFRTLLVRSVRGKCLRFYSASAWKEYIEPLKKLPRKVAEDTFWFLYRDAAQVTPDSLGRVLIPTGLLDFAEIGSAEEGNRSLVVVGCGDFGEIWSEANYEARVQGMDVEAIRRALEESGL